MGREIRMVPANWEHPTTLRHWGREDYQPMYDERFEDAAREWKAGFAAHNPDDHEGQEFWEYHGSPPEREYYRPWKDEEAIWFQVWETVSEGTPVTPPFSTREELIEYLVSKGDFWSQKDVERGDAPRSQWSRQAATSFVNAGWAPSMMVITGGPNAGIYDASTGFPS